MSFLAQKMSMELDIELMLIGDAVKASIQAIFIRIRLQLHSDSNLRYYTSEIVARVHSQLSTIYLKK